MSSIAKYRTLWGQKFCTLYRGVLYYLGVITLYIRLGHGELSGVLYSECPLLIGVSTELWNSLKIAMDLSWKEHNSKSQQDITAILLWKKN